MRSFRRLAGLTRVAVVLAASCIGPIASCQSFGRFGYESGWHLPGFVVSSEGFSITQEAADRIRFKVPSALWKPVLTSDLEQTVLLSEAPGNPSKLRANLQSLGFAAYFPQGIELHLRTLGAPFLSWKEGSVSARIPTPDLNWVVVSFQDHQPPFLLAFPDESVSLTVEGQAGNWVIKSTKDYRGWVRVGLPMGAKPLAANTASSLGSLSLQTAKVVDRWMTPVPEYKDLQVTSDPAGVTATWTFSRAGVVVPPSFLLAAEKGYGVKILSRFHATALHSGDAPVALTDESDLRVWFPQRAFLRGRALGVGEPTFSFLASASPQDAPSLCELALESLYACRDAQTAKLAEETLGEFLSQASYTREPFSGQMLPYSGDGSGSDLAGAAALLMQAMQTASASDEANALLMSLSVRRDWLTNRFWCLDGKRGAHVAGYAALAGAFSSDAKRRLEGALFYTGLIAYGDEPAFLKPLRDEIFGKPKQPSGVAKLLFSPVRVVGAPSVVLAHEKTDLVLRWPAVEPKPSVWSYFGPPASFKARANLTRLATSLQGAELTVHYVPEVAGICEATVLPAAPLFLPILVPPTGL